MTSLDGKYSTYNPLQMNDWEIKKFLTIVFSIQIAIWGLISLDALSLHIPILRQLIGFIYLTFIPGILILRILKLHKLGSIETLLYTVGLSLSTLMFTGFFMNMLYPLFGISSPISLVPLIITISVVVLVLCVLCYVRDKDLSYPSFIDIKDILYPPALFLCLIPFLAVFGTYLVNFYQNNILLMLLIITLALIAISIAFDKFIPENFYHLAVFVIAITLLFHTSLISMYLWGYDIHHEYYLANLVKGSSQWDLTIPANTNAMLSIVMLSPIYSNICGMSLTWVFKIIYPLLFSLVPLGLYQVFRKQTNNKIAFLSCFFFVSISTFYTEMLQLARQEVAELFLVLLILLMINKNMNKTARSFLFIIFGISLAVSHYGTSYLYMFCIIFAWLILVTGVNPRMQKLMKNFYPKFGTKNDEPAANSAPLKIKDRTISSTFVLLFVTFTIAWYIYISSSSPFDTIIHIGNHIASSIFKDFLNPAVAQGLSVIIAKETPMREITKYLHLIAQFFILVGLIALILKREGMKFEREYSAVAYINLVIGFSGIALPHFASALNTSRLYQVILILLAPFCIIGGLTVFRMLSRVVRVSWTEKRARISLKMLSVFLAIFLLFNSGWVYEVAGDHPSSIALSQQSVNQYGDAKDKNAFYTSFYTTGDVIGVKWMSKNQNDNSKIYADFGRTILVFRSYGMMPDEHILTNTNNVPDNSYIFLGYPNVHYRLMSDPNLPENYWNIASISPLLNMMNKIYSNGDVEIYYH